jgi:glyoxylase-like metal-dependent hydrolase (beta-lactamase superfamily II)
MLALGARARQNGGGMKQLTKNVFVETEQRGSNHGVVVTAEGPVLIDGPHKPSDALRLRAFIEQRWGALRYILNTEPHGDHWTSNAYFDAPVIAHAGVRERMLATDVERMISRVGMFGPDEPCLLEGYRLRPPIMTFDREFALHLGDHTFRLVHMPGHTLSQAAIIVEEEGVVFTSDNVFCQVHTWIQEGYPDLWFNALDGLAALPQPMLVPGHGPVCDQRYLGTQRAFLEEWVAHVRGAVDQGMTRNEAVERLTQMTDRYPMDVEQEGMAPAVVRMNVANLYDYVTGTGIHAPSALHVNAASEAVLTSRRAD